MTVTSDSAPSSIHRPAQRAALLERFQPDQLFAEFGGSGPSLAGFRERAILAYERRPLSEAGASRSTITNGCSVTISFP